MKAGKIATLALMGMLGLGSAFAGIAEAKGGRDAQIEQLSAEQREQFKKIVGESRAATVDLRKQLDAKKAELNELLKSETPDAAKAEAISTQIGELKGKLLAAKIQTNAELKKAGLPTRSLDKGDRAPRKGDGKFEGKRKGERRGDRPEAPAQGGNQ